MQITKVELQNFKRFTNLTIDRIPAAARLVLLIGSNGSGKSSVFDAFEGFNRASKGDDFGVVLGQAMAQFSTKSYLQKSQSLLFNTEITTATGTVYTLSGDAGNNHANVVGPNSFYGRTSLRQTPRLTRTQLGQGEAIDFTRDSDRPHFYIDRDSRFENDLDRIYERILQDVFRADTSSRQVKQTYIEPINNALVNIFGLQETNQLSLIEIIPPLEGKIAQIVFRKGQSDIHYDNLSTGEKEVVNILFNLMIRRDLFTDTVYFFDELDLHLNTTLQFNLLREITENWIPAGCQLWTASHSLGFIDYARQNEQAVIIDFDDLDFDLPQVLVPQPKESLDVFEIAVPRSVLARLMMGKHLIICENQNDKYYNLLGLPDTIFVGVQNAREVFLNVKGESHFKGLRDRDFLSDTEIARLRTRYPNYCILGYYNFENYIYHPDNLAELNPAGFDRADYLAEISRQKDERFAYILANLTSSRRGYEEYKTEGILDKTPDAIVDDFGSDEFERFYKFFDMKVEFKKHYLAAFNLSKEQLVSTTWFRQQIENRLH